VGQAIQDARHDSRARGDVTALEEDFMEMLPREFVFVASNHDNPLSSSNNSRVNGVIGL